MSSYNPNLSQGLRTWKEAMKQRRNITLDLRHDDEGDIAVVAVDENGNDIIGGWLVYITRDGKIGRYPDVDESLGFQLDEEGRIVEEESV